MDYWVINVYDSFHKSLIEKRKVHVFILFTHVPFHIILVYSSHFY